MALYSNTVIDNYIFRTNLKDSMYGFYFEIREAFEVLPILHCSGKYTADDCELISSLLSISNIGNIPLCTIEE